MLKFFLIYSFLLWSSVYAGGDDTRYFYKPIVTIYIEHQTSFYRSSSTTQCSKVAKGRKPPNFMYNVCLRLVVYYVCRS